MARGVNKVILIGNLGNDPEVRYLPSGGPVATISIATSESWKDKQTGQTQERTEWHRVVFFNRLAEICGEYLRKGSKVYVEGSIRTRKWQDKTGVERYTTEIMGNSLQMLDSKGGNAGGAPAPDYEGAASSAGAGYTSNYSAGNQTAGASAAVPEPAFSEFDDDIPF